MTVLYSVVSNAEKTSFLGLIKFDQLTKGIKTSSS